MRWLGIFLVIAGAHVPACKGRSTVDERSSGDAGAPNGGQNAATGGRRPTGGTGGTAGLGGSGASVGGSVAAGRGGIGGSAAGRGGTGETSGTGGAPDDACSCDEPFESFSCTVPLTEFCYGPRAFGCPASLEAARQNLDDVCNLDGEMGRYSECAGGYVMVSWIEGGENDYELFFDAATGELVGGLAAGYLGTGDCDYGDVRAGVHPGSCSPTCRFCREFDEGIGGEGGVPGLPRCDFGP